MTSTDQPLVPRGEFSIKTEHLLREIDEAGRALGSQFALSDAIVCRRDGGILRIHSIFAEPEYNRIVIEVDHS